MITIQVQSTHVCREYTIKVFVCGDYEFLCRMYGLSGAAGMLHITTKAVFKKPCYRKIPMLDL